MVDRIDKIIIVLATIILLFVFFSDVKEKRDNRKGIATDTIIVVKIDTVKVEKIKTIYKTKIVEKLIEDGKIVKDSSVIKDTLANKVFLDIITYPAIDSIKIKGFIKDTVKTVWRIDSVVIKEYAEESRPFYDKFEYGVIGGLILAIVLYLIGG